MTENTIEIALAIPEDLLPEIEAYAAQHQAEGTIEYEHLPPSASAGTALKFDPVTGTAIGLIVLKFAGQAALDIAVGVITAVIYDRLKARWQSQPGRNVDIRLTTGEAVPLSLEHPPDPQQLAEKLKESTPA